jgi:uncharacterized damage-inducible protein DinB
LVNELEKTFTEASYAAAPSSILEGIDEELAHRRFENIPRSIYEELWHMAYWQELSLEWVTGAPAPVPETAAGGFPSLEQTRAENWQQLHARFFSSLDAVAAMTRDEAALSRSIVCPSPPGHPSRTMTAREQLENMSAHNAYHFGRIVMLRQMAGSWPPRSGGFTW